jgi:hypothetical protein
MTLLKTLSRELALRSHEEGVEIAPDEAADAIRELLRCARREVGMKGAVPYDRLLKEFVLFWIDSQNSPPEGSKKADR